MIYIRYRCPVIRFLRSDTYSTGRSQHLCTLVHVYAYCMCVHVQYYSKYNLKDIEYACIIVLLYLVHTLNILVSVYCMEISPLCRCASRAYCSWGPETQQEHNWTPNTALQEHSWIPFGRSIYNNLNRNLFGFIHDPVHHSKNISLPQPHIPNSLINYMIYSPCCHF